MLEIKPNDVLKCRTIWISDVHLGSKYCKAKQLLEFLDRIEFEQLYLVGDIVDLLAMRRRVHWPTAHNRVISRFMKLARRKRSRVIYIPGNHDFAFRSMVKNNLGKIAVHRTFVHETVDGKRMLVTHGQSPGKSAERAPAPSSEWVATSASCRLCEGASGFGHKREPAMPERKRD